MPRDTGGIDPVNEVLRRETCEGGAAKVSVVGKKVIRPAIEIGKIAATTTGNTNFGPRRGAAFQDPDVSATAPGLDRAEQSGGAGA